MIISTRCHVRASKLVPQRGDATKLLSADTLTQPSRMFSRPNRWCLNPRTRATPAAFPILDDCLRRIGAAVASEPCFARPDVASEPAEPACPSLPLLVSDRIPDRVAFAIAIEVVSSKVARPAVDVFGSPLVKAEVLLDARMRFRRDGSVQQDHGESTGIEQTQRASDDE